MTRHGLRANFNAALAPGRNASRQRGGAQFAGSRAHGRQTGYLSAASVTGSASTSYDCGNEKNVHESKAGHDSSWGGLMRLAPDGDQNAHGTLLTALAHRALKKRTLAVRERDNAN